MVVPIEPGSDPLIGRTAELAALAAAVAASRLVTVTGLGGIGKTTLAVAFASTARDVDARFVDLAPLAHPREVTPTIAAALGLAEIGATELEGAVVAALGRAPSLLVLDNFEHVLPARDVVQAILDGAAPARILVTSRLALELRGEHAIGLEALQVPAGVADMETADASRLFLRRAREGGGLRAIEAADAEAVVEICQRLEGLPLALELAAAWTRLLSPRAIVRRLAEQRLELAEAGHGRHATLERVVESTLGLVEAPDREAFDALGVFAGGFDEEGAREATGLADVLRVLRRLEAVALVRVTADLEGEPRFRMLETIRAIAAARLANGPRAADVRRRFVASSASRAQAAADALRDLEPAPALAWMTAEAPNLRTAFELARAAGDATLAVQLAMTLATFGVRSGSARESLRRLRAALELGPVPPAIRSEALSAVVNLAVMLSEPDDVAALSREAITLAREADDARREVRAMVALGSYGPPADAADVLTEAQELATRIGYDWAALAAMDNLATFHADAGHWRAALEQFERSVAIAERVGDQDGVGHALANMADACANLGRDEQALSYARLAADRLRVSWPTSATFAWALSVRARCEARNGLQADSARTLVEACDMASSSESEVGLRDVFEAAVVVLGTTRPEVAARAHGAFDVLASAENHPRVPSPLTAWAAQDLRRTLSADRLEHERQRGQRADRWAILAEIRAAAAAAHRAGSRLRVEYGSLTPREVDILRLLANGRSDQQIAAELGISPKTASVHVANIKGKLGVDTRIEASVRARELIGSIDARDR